MSEMKLYVRATSCFLVKTQKTLVRAFHLYMCAQFLLGAGTLVIYLAIRAHVPSYIIDEG